jgi:cell division protein FtsB
VRARLSRWATRPRRQSWLVLVGLGLVAYFGYHAVSGSRGLLSWRGVSAELVADQQELEAVRAERVALERKVKRLRPEALDPDLIDELARRQLSFVEPLDVLILLDAKDRSK